MDSVNTSIEKYKSIMHDVNNYFIKEDDPIIIMEGYEYFREVISLFCRQHNLVEAVFELLKCNMAEEAYILFRSAINNHIVILYLLDNFQDEEKLKNYMLQTLLSQKQLLKNIIRISKNEWFKNMNKDNEMKINLEDVQRSLREINERLRENKIEEISFLSVASMAKENELLFSLYASEYHESSKWEHSDPSTTTFYRDKVIDEYSNDLVFRPNTSKTSIELKKRIFTMTTHRYSYTLIKIVQHISNKQEHLLQFYNRDKIAKIMTLMTIFDNWFSPINSIDDINSID